MSSEAALPPPAPTRLLSLDALRGLTILLMVFVNDLHGSRAAPAWMLHIKPSNADGMTLADIVFPTFLFIAGVSIPLAIDVLRRKGTSIWGILTHIFSRTLALLLLGVIYMNAEDDESLRRPWWALLAFVSVILAWAHVPKEPGRRRNVLIALKGVGIVSLVALLAIFRRDAGNTDLPFVGEVKDYRWLHTEWWEILGLIGWAYLGASLIYLLVGKRREWLMGAVGLLMVLYLADRQGGLLKRVDKKLWLDPLKPAIHTVAGWFDWLGSGLSLDVMFGSLSAIVVAGCVLGTILTSTSDVTAPRNRIKWALGYAAGLFVAGLFTDCFAGINKIGATPAWCFFCSALACATWALLYLVMDVWQRRKWAVVVAPAGANPLIAYLMPSILAWILELIGLGILFRYHDTSSPTVAVLGSFGMAVAVCAATALVGKTGFRMRI